MVLYKTVEMLMSTFEAESIAFIVCNNLQIVTDEYSFPYIATWAQDDHAEILKSSMVTIQNTANEIISKLREKMEQEPESISS